MKTKRFHSKRFSMTHALVFMLTVVLALGPASSALAGGGSNSIQPAAHQPPLQFKPAAHQPPHHVQLAAH